MLNLVAHELFPGKYNSDFAIQITSDIADAQQYAANFANNNLGGHTRFLDGYKSSKTRACVTVGMMTTGYDCRDIMNLCLMRPIFSPTDFIQIKGRGTRRFQFAYSDGHEEHRKEKTSFKLFDFFANCEYQVALRIMVLVSGIQEEADPHKKGPHRTPGRGRVGAE